MFSCPLRPDLDLRLLEERHAAAVYALVNQDRAFLRQWLPWVDATRGEDDTLSFIRSALQRFAANEGITAGIWNRGQFCGVVGTHKVDWLNRRVEMGYWLGREFEGKGIVTDACRAVVKHAFTELDLHRVDIHCAEGNQKSAAVPRRLGFVQEGKLKQALLLDGVYHDMLIFGMVKPDWNG